MLASVDANWGDEQIDLILTHLEEDALPPRFGAHNKYW